MPVSPPRDCHVEGSRAGVSSARRAAKWRTSPSRATQPEEEQASYGDEGGAPTALKSGAVAQVAGREQAGQDVPPDGRPQVSLRKGDLRSGRVERSGDRSTTR